MLFNKIGLMKNIEDPYVLSMVSNQFLG